MMTLNREKIYHVSKPMELMFKFELHCLCGYFRKHTGKEDVSTSLKCFCASPALVFTSKNYIIQWIFTNGNST